MPLGQFVTGLTDALLAPLKINERIDHLAGAAGLAAAAGIVELATGELEHTFAPGLYFRTFTMPAGSFCVGHEHTTEHVNFLRSGHAFVIMDGELHELRGGDIFTSGAGVRKVLFMVEETRWATIHPMNAAEEAETDMPARIAMLENRLRVKSEVHDAYIEQAETLRQLLSKEVQS